MGLQYGLRSLDTLDGLDAAEGPVPARWTVTATPDKDARGYLSIDSGSRQKEDGWWALDDLVAVVAGYATTPLLSSGWTTMHPADVVRAMTVFRMLGTEDRLHVKLPQRYLNVFRIHPSSSDEQVRAAERLRQADTAKHVTAS